MKSLFIKQNQFTKDLENILKGKFGEKYFCNLSFDEKTNQDIVECITNFKKEIYNFDGFLFELLEQFYKIEIVDYDFDFLGDDFGVVLFI